MQPPAIIFGSEGQNSKAKTSSGPSSTNCGQKKNPSCERDECRVSVEPFGFIGFLPSQVFIYSSFFSVALASLPHPTIKPKQVMMNSCSLLFRLKIKSIPLQEPFEMQQASVNDSRMLPIKSISMLIFPPGGPVTEFPYLRLKEVGETVEENEGCFVDKCSEPFLLLCQGYSNHSCHVQKQDAIIRYTRTAVEKVSVFNNHFYEEKTLNVTTAVMFPDGADRLLFGDDSRRKLQSRSKEI